MKIIFAVNGIWKHYRLSPDYRGWLFDPAQSTYSWSEILLPAPCCALPGKLPKRWFDAKGLLEVGEDWQPDG